MTSWLLAIVLLASLAALGYRQGAIRVAFSFVGIIVAALFALLLGRLVRLLFPLLGIHNPLVVWLVPPFIAFVIVLTLFKVGGLAMHKKIEVFFKYHAGDLRYVLWERMNRRVGACLGLANAAAYLVLLSFVIYNLGYWTTALGGSDSDPWTVRLANRLGMDCESTGLTRVGAAVSSMPDEFYQGADVAGLVYHNPLVQDRLATYPGFLSLAQRPEFQALGNDADLGALRLKQAPIADLLREPSVQAIANNQDTVKAVWGSIAPDLSDLGTYLRSGQSPKYDAEPILGYWDFDVGGAIAAYRKNKPQVALNEMRDVKRNLTETFGKIILIAAPDSQAYLKNFPMPGSAAGASPVLQGQWQKSGDHYDLSLNVNGTMTTFSGKIDNGRLTFANPIQTLVFAHE
jgi:Colicin V production protein